MKFLVAFLMAASLLFGCTGKRERIYALNTRGFERAVASFRVTPDQARKIVQDVGEKNHQMSRYSELSLIAGDAYVFEPLRKMGHQYTGLYVHGMTGEVEYRESSTRSEKSPLRYVDQIQYTKRVRLER